MDVNIRTHAVSLFNISVYSDLESIFTEASWSRPLHQKIESRP